MTDPTEAPQGAPAEGFAIPSDPGVQPEAAAAASFPHLSQPSFLPPAADSALTRTPTPSDAGFANPTQPPPHIAWQPGVPGALASPAAQQAAPIPGAWPNAPYGNPPVPQGRYSPAGGSIYPAPPVAPSYSSGRTLTLPDGSEIAGYSRRILARVIDATIGLAIIVLLSVFMGDSFATVTTTTRGYTTNTMYLMTPLGTVITLAVGFILDVATVALFGGQVGKLIVGIRLANATDLKSPIGWLPAIGRWLTLSIAFLVCLIPGLVMGLSPLWDQPYHRGWHDRLVKTIVKRGAPATQFQG